MNLSAFCVHERACGVPAGVRYRPTHKQLIAFFNGWGHGHQVPRSSDAEVRFLAIASCNPRITLSGTPPVHQQPKPVDTIMSISITVQGTDKPSLIAALLVALVALGGTAPAGNAATTAGSGAAAGGAKAPTEAEKKAAAEKAAKEKAAADKAAKAAADKAAKEAAAKGDEGITLESLRELGKAAIKAGKNAEMRALLSKLGSESITALDTDKYADFKSGIDAIIAGEEPAASEEDSAL